MKLSNWTITRMCLVGGLLLSALVSPSVAQDATGVARISKAGAPKIQQTAFDDVVEDGNAAAAALVGPPSDNWSLVVQPVGKSRNIEYYGGFDGGCPNGCEMGDCPSCRSRGGFGRHGGHGGWCDACGKYHGCNNGRAMFDYLHCKFGYFCPSGRDGKGSPWFGCYSRVYPQDVNHFDQRDGQVYAAQGYGVPIAVPLAPVVGHTYNYGWGVPSSRLTPISNVARY